MNDDRELGISSASQSPPPPPSASVPAPAAPPPAAAPSESAPPPPIQFDRVEYAPPPATTCALCQQPITDRYYGALGKAVCMSCRDSYVAVTTGGSRFRRLFRALAFGLGAGVIGAAIWLAVRKFTGYEVGIVAIVVGFLVGAGVRKGCDGRGGFGYQLLAVLLTYSCIVATYVPDVFSELLAQNRQEKALAAQAATAPATNASSQPTTMAATSTEADEEAKFANMSVAKKAGLLVLFAILLFVIAFIAPIAGAISSPIHILIIGFALWEAWKLNARRIIQFTGPHPLTSLPRPAPSPQP